MRDFKQRHSQKTKGAREYIYTEGWLLKSTDNWETHEEQNIHSIKPYEINANISKGNPDSKVKTLNNKAQQLKQKIQDSYKLIQSLKTQKLKVQNPGPWNL